MEIYGASIPAKLELDISTGKSNAFMDQGASSGNQWQPMDKQTVPANSCKSQLVQTDLQNRLPNAQHVSVRECKENHLTSSEVAQNLIPLQVIIPT